MGLAVAAKRNTMSPNCEERVKRGVKAAAGEEVGKPAERDREDLEEDLRHLASNRRQGPCRATMTQMRAM